MVDTKIKRCEKKVYDENCYECSDMKDCLDKDKIKTWTKDGSEEFISKSDLKKILDDILDKKLTKCYYFIDIKKEVPMVDLKELKLELKRRLGV